MNLNGNFSQKISSASVNKNLVNMFSKIGKSLLLGGVCLTTVLVADMFVNRGRTGEKLEINKLTNLIESVPVSYYERAKNEIANNQFVYPHVTLPGKVNDIYQGVKKDINVLVNKDKPCLSQDKQLELLHDQVNYPNSFVGKIID